MRYFAVHRIENAIHTHHVSPGKFLILPSLAGESTTALTNKFLWRA